MKADLEFQFKPFATVGFVVFGGLFLALSVWQVQRYLEKAELENIRNERLDKPVLEIGTPDRLEAPETEYRLARLQGEYVDDKMALIRGRRLNRRVGCWVIAPFRLESGGYVMVNRGWIPVDRRQGCERDKIAQIPSDAPSPVGIVSREQPDSRGQTATGSSRSGETWTEWRRFVPGQIWKSWGLSPHPAEPVVLVLRSDNKKSETGQRPGARKPDYPMAVDGQITNPYLSSLQHLNYAATWLIGLLAVLAIYLAYSFGVYDVLIERIEQNSR